MWRPHGINRSSSRTALLARVVLLVAAAGMLTALWLPWYELGTPSAPTQPDGGIVNFFMPRLTWTAWRAFEVTDVVLAIAGLGLAICSVLRGPLWRRLALAAALVAVALVAFRTLSVPVLVPDRVDPEIGRVSYPLVRITGVWVALVSAIGASAAALLGLVRPPR